MTSPPEPRSRRPIVIAAGAALAAAAVVAIVLVARPDPPLPPPGSGVAAVAPPDTITLRVESTPPGAEVYRASDNVLAGKTPYTLTREATDGQIVYLIKLAGHRDQRIVLPADRDHVETVVLDPVK